MALVDVLVVFGLAAPSIILHEVSHGFAALHFGDDTAKRRGRLTLNPVAHVDPVGTLLLPAILALSGFGVIGYAKPVPVNVRRLRKPRDHAVLVALAGPATNLLLAAAAALVLRATGGLEPLREGETWTFAAVVGVLGLVNLLLGFFNLLPIPPLDGSAVLERFLPRSWLPTWYRIRIYSMFVLLALVLFVGLGDLIVEPAIDVFEAMAG